MLKVLLGLLGGSGKKLVKAAEPAAVAQAPSVEELMQRHRQPAVMAYRPYPPSRLPRVNSHLGGLPRLPEGFEWPRTSGGVPLHFLAAIDCGELPATDGVLPGYGILFFFARIDEEMIWGDGDPKEDCRVLYAPRLGSAETAAPADLPPLMGGYSDLNVYVLPGEKQASLYPRWPLAFRAIESWPDGSAIDYRMLHYRDYQQAVEAARAGEAIRALGLSLEQRPQADWDKYRTPTEPLALPPEVAGQPFPQVWIMVDRIARYLVTQTIARAAKIKDIDMAQLEESRAEAMQWIATAGRRGLDQPVDASSARAFASWLTKIADPGGYLRTGIGSAVSVGLRRSVEFTAAFPRAAALVPALYYQDLEARQLPVRQVKNQANEPVWRLSGAYHQMLGNAGSSQQAPSVEGNDVLLLQLNSDYGVDFMFCDVGEVEFRIDKDDLAARRFDKVFATTCGG